ncbi:MAG: hypothetical protein ACOCQX_02815 [Candidatus Nanoarchaeia archaeon]
MLLNLPFLKDYDNSLQASAEVAAKFLAGTNNLNLHVSFPIEILPPLKEIGLEVKYFSSVRPCSFELGELKSTYPYLQIHGDINSLERVWEKAILEGLFEQKKLDVHELLENFSQHSLIIAGADSGEIYGKESKPIYVPVTGFDEEGVFYHDLPAGEENCKLTYRAFAKANEKMNNDIILIKRN